MTKRYCEIYDVMYGRFGKWLESKCQNKECEYCSKRPRRHLRSCKCKKEEVF